MRPVLVVLHDSQWSGSHGPVGAISIKMKTNVQLLVPVIALIWASCQQDPRESEAYQQLAQDQGRTEQMVHAKDSALNAVFATMNRISENLRTIRQKQDVLSESGDGAENAMDAEQRILDDIGSIDRLLEENKQLIARLKADSKAAKGRLAELERTVTDLEQLMRDKDLEIGSLKEQLASTNSSLASLIEMYRDKEQLADLQRNELNTAWYSVGTARELRDNGVLTKSGGVVGIGGSNKLKTQGLNQEYFKQVDIVQTLTIPVNAKKAKLATSHPEGSYLFEGQVASLVITDPDRFWSMSKYLVVVVD